MSVERLAIVRLGLLELPRFVKQSTQIDVRVGVIRSQGQGLAVRLDRASAKGQFCFATDLIPTIRIELAG